MTNALHVSIRELGLANDKMLQGEFDMVFEWAPPKHVALKWIFRIIYLSNLEEEGWEVFANLGCVVNAEKTGDKQGVGVGIRRVFVHLFV